MFKKKSDVFWLLALVLILAFNVYVRLYPAFFPHLKEAAKYTVKQDMRKDIATKVKESHPELNAQLQVKLIDQIQEQSLKNKTAYSEKVENKYIELLDKYQDPNGRTYLQELDPYHWYRYTQLVLDNGFPGDRLEGKLVKDDYMLAPNGLEVINNRFFFYLSAYLYKAYSFFDRDIDLMEFVFYLPVFFSFLWLLSIFLAVRSFFSLPTAVLALMLAGGARMALFRGTAGWYDMDMISITFPVLIFAFAAKALSKKGLKLFIYSILSGLFCALYAYTWLGWIQAFAVLGLYIFYKSLNDISLNAQDKDRLKEKILTNIFVLLFFVAAMTMFFWLLSGNNPLNEIWHMCKLALGLDKSYSASIWPNTFFTVGELKKGSFSSMSNALYGSLAFVLGIFSMLLVYIKDKRSKAADFAVPMIFTFMLMIYATLRGVRFALFLVTPWAILFAETIVTIFKSAYLRILSLENLRFRYLLLSLKAFFIALLLQMVFYGSVNAVKNVYPMINDDMYESLEHLKEKTEENAIINSWWDFGDWYKTVADRAVIFDGQSQTTSNAFWMAKAMYSDDVREVANILRMINNINSELYSIIDEEINDQYLTIALMNNLMKLDRAKAEDYLNGLNISDSLQKEIIDYIFIQEPRPAYFVVDVSLLPKTGEISYLGNWNHLKLYLKQNIALEKEVLFKQAIDLFAVDTQTIEKHYQEMLLAQTSEESSEILSKRVNFIGKISKGKETEEGIFFDNGLFVSPDELKSRIFIPKSGYKIPKFLSFYDGEEIRNIEYNEEDESDDSSIWSRGGFIVYKDGEDWKTIGASDIELADSLLVRLYCMKGHGFKAFESFYENEDAGVKVYKINWNYREVN